MILNNYILTYLVCAAMSLFTGIMAAFSGLYIWKRWNPANPAEDQYLLEKKVYLVITISSLGFLLRLLMFPLWFGTLHSMIISIPGAMCLAGVHNINPPLAYTASGLKLIMPVFYGYWLIMNFMDRKLPEQPFMKPKLLLMTITGCLVFVETILDTTFFFSAPPRQVSCCTSLFDIPGKGILQVVAGPSAADFSMLWIFLFFGLSVFLIGEMIFLIKYKKNIDTKLLNSKWGIAFQTLMVLFLFGTLIIALQEAISPLFLNLPFHHCIFCLCQEVWDATLSFFMIFAGLSLFLIYSWIASLAKHKIVEQKLNTSIQKILKCSAGLFGCGIIILTIHLIIVTQ